MKRRRTLPPPPLPQVTCLETPPTQCDNWRWVEAGKGHGRDRRSRSLSLTSTPVFWQKPRPRCFRRRRIEDKTHQIPGNRLTALNARLAAGTRVLEIRFRASGARAARSRDTQTRTRPDKRTDSASGERGPGLPRGAGSDESLGGGEPALHPRRDRAGGVPGGERGVPAPPPRELGGPAPPPLPAVCGSVRRSPGLLVSGPSRAALRGPPNFSALPCAAPSAPPRLQHRRAPGPGLRAQGSGGPWRWRPPPPPPRAPSLRRPHRSLAVPSAQSPALRSDPCPRRSPPAPRPPRPADPGSAATSPPRAGLCLSRSLPPPGSLSPRVAVSVSVALPVGSLPSSTPARSLPCVSLPLSVSLGSLSLSPSHSRCGPPRLRTQAPVACAASPARPPGSPSSRRPRRAENSQLAAPAPLCETFAPPHT